MPPRATLRLRVMHLGIYMLHTTQCLHIIAAQRRVGGSKARVVVRRFDLAELLLCSLYGSRYRLHKRFPVIAEHVGKHVVYEDNMSCRLKTKWLHRQAHRSKMPDVEREIIWIS